ncbi:MAG: ABC transporter ATP-binding protein [Phycisphaerae bacterium]|nr:ABC transporter ATP-binding protein [Phycisphaerae bacterium]
MEHLNRVLKYVFKHYKLVIISIICALGTATLFAASLTAMLPLMKIIITDEGMAGWVNRSVIKSSSGLSFSESELNNFSQQTAKIEKFLIISKIKDKSPSDIAGLKIGDKLLAVSWTDDNGDVQTTSNFLAELDKLAWAQNPQLKIEHSDNSISTLNLNPGDKPFYAPLAKNILAKLPHENSVEFKRKCMVALIIMMLIATILRCLLRFIQEYLVRIITFKTLQEIRQETYRNTIRLPLSFFSNEGVSDTMSRYIQDTNKIQSGITVLLGKCIREPFTILTMAIGAFLIDAQMTLIVITCVPIAGFAMNRLGKKMKKATKRTLENWSKLLSKLHDTFMGIRVVKGYCQEDNESRNFLNINDNLVKQQLRMARVDAGSGPLLECVAISGACVGMIFAADWIASGKMDPSSFFTISILLGSMAEAGRKLGSVFPKIQTANASAQRVFELHDAPQEKYQPQAKPMTKLQSSLEFKDINFTYQGSPVQNLTNINLKVQAGQTIAIVGPNGSGKTTLLSLIPRFFVPDSGQVIIDGTNTADVALTSLRSQIGIVTQQTIVFNETIKTNLSYGVPNATDEQIIEAAKQAFAHEFIANTANGYDTIVGESGSTLSGGQLQRMAIARAILSDPAILIFDEATSQIDSDSEVKIQKALEEFSKTRTSFVIAHRLSTVIGADKIVVMDQGQIIAAGKHQQLLKECELYKTLYNMQFGHQEE